MPKVVGLKNSNFDAERYKSTFSPNVPEEEELKTKHFKEGLEKVGDFLDESYIDSLKKSPSYISKK